MLSEYMVTQAFLYQGGAEAGAATSANGQKERTPSVDPMLLLVSPDAALVIDLQRVFLALGLSVKTVADVDTGMEAMECFGAGRQIDVQGSNGQDSDAAGPGIVLLDARLPGVGSGRLLAAVQECGVHDRCALALIAEQVSDDWIARLREGVIDDIVPRNADVATWRTHISTMQRGHTLSRELERLRELAALEHEHDPVTGTLLRAAMMSVLFRETDRVQRLHGSLSLLMVGVADLEHWRAEFGPAAGDQLLRDVAGRTTRLLRSYDVLGRMDGDTLLIILPGCGTVDAVMLAERMRMEVFAESFQVKGGPSQGAVIRLTANFAITASRERSAVVVVREAEDTLAACMLEGPEAVRCTGERIGGQRVRPATWGEPGIGASDSEDIEEDAPALYPTGEMFAW